MKITPRVKAAAIMDLVEQMHQIGRDQSQQHPVSSIGSFISGLKEEDKAELFDVIVKWNRTTPQ